MLRNMTQIFWGKKTFFFKPNGLGHEGVVQSNAFKGPLVDLIL